MFRALLTLLASILRSAIALFRSRENQAIVELALRQQLAVYVHRHPRPRLSPLDRAFWVALSRFWPHWRSALVVVRPETVIRWHRKAFRGYWRWISKPGPGRPPISEETKALISGWRPRMAGASERSRESFEARNPPRLDDDRPVLAEGRGGREPGSAVDDVPEEPPRRDRRNGLLRRPDRALHAALRLVRPRSRETACPSLQRDRHPSARWVIQQLRETFPDHPTHRYLVLDNDAIFSANVVRTAARFGLHPQRTALQSPWQNGTADASWGRFVASFSIMWSPSGEDHLRRLLREYVEYYNPDRVHTSIGDSPAGPRQKRSRRAESRSSGSRASAVSMADTPGGTLLEHADE